MPKEKRPLVVAEAVAMRLSDLLAPSCDRLMIGGSIRRRRPEVGDIELIAIPRMVAASPGSLIDIRPADLFGMPSTPQADELLTPRQREILKLLANGHSYDDIGLALDLSVNTVRSHVRAIYERLGASTKVEAVVTAMELKLIDRDSFR